MAKKSILGSFRNDDINKYGLNNQIENVYYKKIKPAAKNRVLRNVDVLAEDIAIDGLESNLVIRKIEDPNYEYELVAGHRRYEAIKTNLANGDMTYEYIPCKVIMTGDLDARRRLILNNFNMSPYTEAEKLECVDELKEIFKMKKELGEKLPGRMQALIAKEMGLEKSQVGNYEKILNRAVPEVRELINEGEMTISAAVELSSLNDDDQITFVETSQGFDLKTVKDYRKTLEDSNSNLYESYETDADDKYEDISDEFDENEEIFDDYSQNNTPQEQPKKKQTIEDSLKIIMEQIDVLNSKMAGVEFRAERTQLTIAGSEMEKLLLMLNIEYE